jgi:hypothetical protein
MAKAASRSGATRMRRGSCAPAWNAGSLSVAKKNALELAIWCYRWPKLISSGFGLKSWSPAAI